MMRSSLLVLALAVGLMTVSCASPKKPAEDALAQAVTAWNAIKSQVMEVMPEEAPAVEAGIADATSKLASADYKGALAAATDVGAKVKMLSDQLETRTQELQAQWKEISGAMPATIKQLTQKLRGFPRLAPGSPGAADSPQAQFAQLKSDWDAAQSDMLNGHLAKAVAKAVSVRDLAVRLLTDLQDGS